MIEEVFVAFRIYDEKEGHKEDTDGRMYIGWSNKYDEWKSINDVTLQRYNSIVKHYK